jgi:hypothetical protein
MVAVLAASCALGVIIFNINKRGHYVYCGPDGCLSTEAVGRFLVPFVFLFAKFALALFFLWFAFATVRQIARNISARRTGRSVDVGID